MTSLHHLKKQAGLIDAAQVSKPYTGERPVPLEPEVYNEALFEGRVTSTVSPRRASGARWNDNA